MERVEYEKLIVQDLRNLHTKRELDLNPWYQRREVWRDSQKAYLINTLFESKPIPTLYIRHTINIDLGKSIREVVDGQQRCRAILEYIDGKFAARHPNHATRVLYSKLSSKEKERLLLTALPVGFLLGATDEDVVDIFGRINSVAKTLNPQEKRNANFSGEFKQFCLSEATKRLSLWRRLGIFSENDIARMQEVQFVSELVMALLSGEQDQRQKAIDDTYAEHDENFADASGVGKRLDRVFNLISECDPDAFSQTIFKRAPIFYSLLLVLDERKKIKAETLEDALWYIDGAFQTAAGGGGTKSDRDFVDACSSSTQRKKMRTRRRSYLDINI